MPAIWSSTELNVAILCSCLPTLKGLISRIWPKLLSTGNTGQRSSQPRRSLGRMPAPQGQQQQWEEELKSPRYNLRPYYDQSPTAPTFLETDSESSLPIANRIHVTTNTTVHKGAKATADERDSTPTLTRGEDMRYMLRNPTYKV